MTPLIDGDVLLHELGWSGEFKNKDTGEWDILPFDHVQQLLDKKIEVICYEARGTKPPILFFTNTEWLSNYLKCPYTPNFRYDIAVTKPYKGNRKNPKPFHFYNITVYLLANYNVIVSRGGLEADDEMCLYQSSTDQETIICSRDKDLRICPGWHYSWECGKQTSIGPHFTDRLGDLRLKVKQSTNTKTGKVTKIKEVWGYGLKFFFAQMLIGDKADFIPGLPLIGDAKAYEVLADLTTEEEMFKAVASLYKEKMGKNAGTYFREQADLLWMKQKNKPIYKFGE